MLAQTYITGGFHLFTSLLTGRGRAYSEKGRLEPSAGLGLGMMRYRYTPLLDSVRGDGKT